ncbi:MAG: hypothetical protein JHC93_01055 [Parachlamydiales bacterium]|nr:hypothetical protein [Parachlamydiales bacterium]
MSFYNVSKDSMNIIFSFLDRKDLSKLGCVDKKMASIVQNHRDTQVEALLSKVKSGEEIYLENDICDCNYHDKIEWSSDNETNQIDNYKFTDKIFNTLIKNLSRENISFKVEKYTTEDTMTEENNNALLGLFISLS